MRRREAHGPKWRKTPEHYFAGAFRRILPASKNLWNWLYTPEEMATPGATGSEMAWAPGITLHPSWKPLIRGKELMRVWAPLVFHLLPVTSPLEHGFLTRQNAAPIKWSGLMVASTEPVTTVAE